MGAHVSVVPIPLKDLHLNILPRATQRAFLVSSEFEFLLEDTWYLAGGTALALQVGHRVSVDLDFFLPKTKFDETALECQLLATKKWTSSFRASGTVYGVLDKAKMSFIAYPFFRPSKKRLACGKIRLLLPEDIAVMKIIAISQRGRKRDFLDLYWYCKHQECLVDVIYRSLKQYPGQENNLNHILRSLVYFDDAESDPMPQTYFVIGWPEIKTFFRREVPKITRNFLGLK